MKKIDKLENINLSKTTLDFNSEFHVTLIRIPTISPVGGMSFSSIVPPITLAILSANLRAANIAVTNIDAVGEDLNHIALNPKNPKFNYQGLSPEEIIKRIPLNTNLLAVSCMFSNEWPFTRDVIQTIKKARPEIPIIAGGEHVSALPEYVLNTCPELDFIAIGEGDETVTEIANAFKNKTPIEEINGIGYLKDKKLVRTPPRKRLRALDTLPWPAWDLVPIQNYFDLNSSHGPYRGRTMPIIASRGCPYNCSFCSNEDMYGRSYYTRDVKCIVDEIEYYIEKYQIKCIDFFDLTIFINRQWTIDFCKELIKRDVKIVWQVSGGTRTEPINEEVIYYLKKAGCEYLCFAPETGSKEVLKMIRKRCDLDRMVSLFKISNKYKLDTRANLIIGFPNETRKQIWETILFQAKLALIGVLDAPIFIFSPYPGTDDFRLLQKRGVIAPDSELKDDFFEDLGVVGVNRKIRVCKAVSDRELKFYQLTGMLIFYGIYYLRHPVFLMKFIKNLFVGDISHSVFEHRIIQNVRNFFIKIGLKKIENKNIKH